MNAQEYKELVNSTYELILKEISNPKDIESQYPEFVIMYEFFRLLRGEAFLNFREPVGEYQKDIYAMEDNIFKILTTLKEQIPEGSEKAKFNMDNIISIGLQIP